MKKEMNISFALVVGLISIIGFGLIAFGVRANRVLRFDEKVINVVQGWEAPFLTNVMKFFTWIGSVRPVLIIFIVVLCILFFVLKNRPEFILFGTVMVGTPALNFILKQIFQRARPELNRLIEIGGYSFPSGHAMHAFALYGILTFLLWRHIEKKSRRIILIVVSTVVILLIGISRIYLGVHYPSDIIGGYLAGALWLAVSIWLFQRYRAKQEDKTAR